MSAETAETGLQPLIGDEMDGAGVVRLEMLPSVPGLAHCGKPIAGLPNGEPLSGNPPNKKIQ